ncbi:MAG: response regulator [Coriobacteriia bacterium]|nr:response regulator [Coriobacteriia bacterium]
MARILVADDSAEARHLLRVILTHAGHEVVETPDGAEALKRAQSEPFDLVISDGLMPVMDGFRLCLELKRDPELAGLPFIFHTASFTHPDDLQLASAMGADAYLLKPVEPAELIRTVNEVLRSHSSEGRTALTEARLVSILDRYGGRIERKLDQKVAALDESRALRDSYHALLDHLPVHIVTLDESGKPDFSNETSRTFTGQLEASALLAAVHPEDAPAAAAFLGSLVRDPHPMHTSMRISRHDGAYRVFEVSGLPYKSPDGVRLGFVLAALDVTQREQQKELLLHAAEHDPLTDLPTRHVFDRRFDEILRNVGKGSNCALLFVDSDSLKGVNDRYGFDVGDATVANLAHAITDAVRPGDLVARLCATEFVVLAEGLGWDEASDLSDTLCAAIARSSLVPAAPEMRLSVNVAINVIPEVRLLHAAARTAPAADAKSDSERRLIEALEGPPAMSFNPVYSLPAGHLARCAVRYAYAVEERLVAGDELALGAAKHGVARRVNMRIVELTLEHTRAAGVPCSMQLSTADVLDPTIFERAELAASRLAVDPAQLLFEIPMCSAGGIRPPAGWLQAAQRSPIRLVHSCIDFSSLGTNGTSALGADEIELPVSAVLDEAGQPRPNVRELLEQWREAGSIVTVTGVEDSSALAALETLGVARVAGTMLAPAASNLCTVPRSLRMKG